MAIQRLEDRVLELEKTIKRLERDSKKGLVVKEAKSLSAVSDPNLKEGEIAVREVAQGDVRLVVKWNGRLWSFFANKSTAPTEGTSIVALTDNTGGSGNDTLVAISGSGVDSDLNDNFADVIGKINELRTALVNLGYVK